MQGGHPAVIAPEKREEVLGEIVLVEVGQGADDAEIKRDVTIEVGPGGAHKDVARMHVGMEKAVAKDLGKKDFDALA